MNIKKLLNLVVVVLIVTFLFGACDMFRDKSKRIIGDSSGKLGSGISECGGGGVWTFSNGQYICTTDGSICDGALVTLNGELVCMESGATLDECDDDNPCPQGKYCTGAGLDYNICKEIDPGSTGNGCTTGDWEYGYPCTQAESNCCKSGICRADNNTCGCEDHIEDCSSNQYCDTITDPSSPQCEGGCVSGPPSSCGDMDTYFCSEGGVCEFRCTVPGHDCVGDFFCDQATGECEPLRNYNEDCNTTSNDPCSLACKSGIEGNYNKCGCTDNVHCIGEPPNANVCNISTNECVEGIELGGWCTDTSDCLGDLYRICHWSASDNHNICKATGSAGYPGVTGCSNLNICYKGKCNTYGGYYSLGECIWPGSGAVGQMCWLNSHCNSNSCDIKYFIDTAEEYGSCE